MFTDTGLLSPGRGLLCRGVDFVRIFLTVDRKSGLFTVASSGDNQQSTGLDGKRVFCNVESFLEPICWKGRDNENC